MDRLNQPLSERDLKRAQRLKASGRDVNKTGRSSWRPICRAILMTINENARMRIVKVLVEAGASVQGDENGSPMFSAVINQDTEMIQFLIDHGANPAEENDAGEPIYDWAEFDYRLQAWGENLEIPEDPDERDKVSKESWLNYLDRMAIKYGKRRPDYLYLLRANGARSYSEMHPNPAL